MNAQPPADALFRKLRANAAREDRGQSLAASVGLLRQAGALADSGQAHPARTARLLARVAGANLSAARLLEGHVNVLRLIAAHGSAAQAAEVAQLVQDGAFLGVWGADSEVPVRLDDGAGILHGHKVYASGLGVVTHALVSVGTEEGTRLGLLDVRDTRRQDSAAWDMPGMRATRSGRFDFTGLRGEDAMWIGPPGSFTAEPTFIGGVWRIAALQLGGAVGLLDCASARLAELGRLEAEAQMIRLAPLAMRALAAERLVTRAADFAESGAARAEPERAVALSASARLLTEDLGLQTIAAAEQSLGLMHFRGDSESGRMARDLAVYMRQAARDALVLRAGGHLLRAQSLWEMMP